MPLILYLIRYRWRDRQREGEENGTNNEMWTAFTNQEKADKKLPHKTEL